MRRFLHTLLVALLIAGLGFPAQAEQFIGGASQPQLTAALTTSLEYKGTPTGGNATFSRGSARVFQDFEGNYVRTTNTNEAVFKARRVENLLADDSSEDFSVAGWAVGGTATVTGTNTLNFPGTNDRITQFFTFFGGQTYTFSVSLSGSGTVSITFVNNADVAASKQITLSATPQRVSVSYTIPQTIGTGTDGVQIRRLSTNSDTATQVTATNAQLEEVTGQTVQTPSEYTSTHQYYGGQVVKGVRYFDTENGNTVDGDGVVTEATGAAIPAATLTGYQYDGASTNKIAGAYNAVGPDMLGSELLTTTADRDMSGANSWGNVGLATMDVNSTVAGKLYMLGDGGAERAAIGSITAIGKVYYVSLKARLNAGASTTIRVGSGDLTGAAETYFTITPTSTETTYTGSFVNSRNASSVSIGLPTGLNGIAFEIDDVSVKEIGASNLSGVFVSGLGEDAKAFYDTAWRNPIPGMTVSGDAAGILSIVSDSAKLATAKLTRLIPSGKVYKADNSTGVADMIIDMAGNLSAATHTISLFARGASAADDAIELGDVTTGTGAPIALTDAYALVSYTFTAAVAATRLIVGPGDTAFIALMQSAALTVADSRIIVEGAAASRSRDALTIPVADGTNFRQREGTTSTEITWGFGSASVPNSDIITIAAPSTSLNQAIYFARSGGGVLEYLFYDGTGTSYDSLSEFSLGDSTSFKNTWSTSKNRKNAYTSTDGWAAATDYDGDLFLGGGNWQFFYNSAYPFALKNLRVLGTADPGGM